MINRHDPYLLGLEANIERRAATTEFNDDDLVEIEMEPYSEGERFIAEMTAEFSRVLSLPPSVDIDDAWGDTEATVVDMPPYLQIRDGMVVQVPRIQAME